MNDILIGETMQDLFKAFFEFKQCVGISIFFLGLTFIFVVV